MLRTLTIALFSLAVTAAACKKAEDQPADPTAVAKPSDPAPKPGDPTYKPAKPAEGSASAAPGDPAAPPPPSKPNDPATTKLVTEALAKMGQFKDQLCACKDKACSEKLQQDIEVWGQDLSKKIGKDFHPDAAMEKQLADLQTAMTACAAALLDPNAPPPQLGENSEVEAKALVLMDKLADTFAADAKDCEKLATDLKKFVADNKEFLKVMQAFETKQTPKDRQAFGLRNKARNEAAMAKMAPAVQGCSTNENVKAALKDMPM